MTAIVIVYTSAGFVIAADGRGRSDDPASTGERDTDQARKIFSIENENRTLAYALAGFAASDDGAFDLIAQAQEQAELFSGRRFEDCHAYIYKFCHNLKMEIGKARRNGRISEFPKNEHMPPDKRARIARLFFVGYFKNQPCWMITSFVHDEKDRVRFNIEHAELIPGKGMCVGSLILAKLMFENHDPRFAQYCKPIPANGSLDDAVEYAKGYIQACAHPSALEIDPICKWIGGRIHIATVTIAGGFKWVPGYEPISAAGLTSQVSSC